MDRVMPVAVRDRGSSGFFRDDGQIDEAIFENKRVATLRSMFEQSPFKLCKTIVR